MGMKHWTDTYPHMVHATALLVDNKIVGWKVGQDKYEDLMRINSKHWYGFNHSEVKLESASWEVNSPQEHSEAFEKHAKEWYKQWKMHEKSISSPPY